MHFVPGPGLPGPAPAGPGKAPGRWGGRCPARRKSPLATCKIDHRRGSPPAAACGRAASKPASRGLHVPRPSACRRWLAAATLDSVLTAARARLHRLHGAGSQNTGAAPTCDADVEHSTDAALLSEPARRVPPVAAVGAQGASTEASDAINGTTALTAAQSVVSLPARARSVPSLARCPAGRRGAARRPPPSWRAAFGMRHLPAGVAGG